MIIKIIGKFPSLNDIIQADRTHWQMGAKLKAKATGEIGCQVLSVNKIDNPIWVNFTYYLPKTDRRDPDNIAAGFHKFFFDALQERNKIKNDSRKEIIGFSDSFEIGNDWMTVVELSDVRVLPAHYQLPNQVDI